jgi:hypothetical protein
MKTRRFNFSLLHLRTIVASLMLVLALALIPAMASAGTVTFSFADSCHECDPPGNLWTANAPGLSTVEYGIPIDTVTGGTGSYHPSGQLTFTSAPATSLGSSYDPPFTWSALYANPGGSGTITDPGGFGWLLNIAYFQGDGSSGQYDKPGGYAWYQSSYVGDINPALLSALGLDPRFTHGYGTISDSGSGDYLEWDRSVTLTFTPSPEPGTLALFGSGIVGLAGMLRRKFLS